MKHCTVYILEQSRIAFVSIKSSLKRYLTFINIIHHITNQNQKISFQYRKNTHLFSASNQG